MGTLILGISGARGIVDDGLDEGVARRLAAAFGALVGPGDVVLGRDSRPSGPRICGAVAAALRSCGCTVMDLGIVPTPTVQVAVEVSPARGGIVVTASHNPPQWNALKFVSADGTFLGPQVMTRLIEAFRASSSAGGCEITSDADAIPFEPGGPTSAGVSAVACHIDRIHAVADVDAIRAAKLRVVVDAVHGAGSVLLAPLLRSLGVEVAWVDGEPDGKLPDHPEPRAERLAPLAARVQAARAALGFALDPDGDRCALVLPDHVLGEEWTLPLCALSRLSRAARGPLVTNLSTSALIEVVAKRFGVDVLRTPVGEANVVGRAREVGALLAGEGNGGVIDPAVHWGRDAGVAVTHLLQLEASTPDHRGGIAREVAQLPALTMHKHALEIAREQFPELDRKLREQFGPPADERDGLRWTWPHSWLHVRPSGTEPIVRVIAEAETTQEADDLVARAISAAEV